MKLIDADKINYIRAPIAPIFNGDFIEWRDVAYPWMIDLMPEESAFGTWINVKDRLPENYKTVLVWIAGSGIYDIAIYSNDYGFRPWYSAELQDCTIEWSYPVTHWMLPPKAPEIEGKKKNDNSQM